MDASSIALDLFHHSIIPDSVLETIAKADGPRHRNSILYDCLLRACTNNLCVHNPNDEYIPHQILGYTAGSLPLGWKRSTYRLEIAMYIEGDKLHPGTLSRIVTELVAIVLTRVISYP